MDDPSVRSPEALALPGVGCQVEAMPEQLPGGPPSRSEPWAWYLRRRGHNFLVQAGLRLARVLGRSRAPAPVPEPAAPLPAAEVVAGDRVRVRSAEAIRSSLDARCALHGCVFAVGMYDFCGRELRVARVVERFFDEAQGRMLRGRNLVLLEGAHCDGSISHHCHGCDRMCFYFWRTEWLEKVGPDPGSRP